VLYKNVADAQVSLGVVIAKSAKELEFSVGLEHFTATIPASLG